MLHFCLLLKLMQGLIVARVFRILVLCQPRVCGPGAHRKPRKGGVGGVGSVPGAAVICKVAVTPE